MVIDRASKGLACFCTFFGGLIFVLELAYLVFLLSRGHIPEGLVEPLLIGLAMFLIGLVLIDYNNKNRWGLGPVD